LQEDYAAGQGGLAVCQSSILHDDLPVHLRTEAERNGIPLLTLSGRRGSLRGSGVRSYVTQSPHARNPVSGDEARAVFDVGASPAR
jgi:hypothetical protein